LFFQGVFSRIDFHHRFKLRAKGRISNPAESFTPSLVEPFGRDNCPKGQNRENSVATQLKIRRLGATFTDWNRCIGARPPRKPPSSGECQLQSSRDRRLR
jgi:hypothetical protein